jgi:hypothetical protein
MQITEMRAVGLLVSCKLAEMPEAQRSLAPRFQRGDDVQELCPESRVGTVLEDALEE